VKLGYRCDLSIYTIWENSYKKLFIENLGKRKMTTCKAFSGLINYLLCVYKGK